MSEQLSEQCMKTEQTQSRLGHRQHLTTTHLDGCTLHLYVKSNFSINYSVHMIFFDCYIAYNLFKGSFLSISYEINV